MRLILVINLITWDNNRPWPCVVAVRFQLSVLVVQLALQLHQNQLAGQNTLSPYAVHCSLYGEACPMPGGCALSCAALHQAGHHSRHLPLD